MMFSGSNVVLMNHASSGWNCLEEEGLRRALGIDGRDNFSQQLSINLRACDVIILTVTDGIKYVTNRGKDISKRCTYYFWKSYDPASRCILGRFCKEVPAERLGSLHTAILLSEATGLRTAF